MPTREQYRDTMVNSGIISEGKYLVARPQLTALEIDLQAVTLRRKWDQLFDMTGGSVKWQTEIYPPMLGKYSFIDRQTTVYPISQLYQPVKTGGRVTTVRQYVPFSESDIRSYIYSKHYRVQENWNCTDEQREKTVQHLFGASNVNKKTYSSGTWEHIFPIFPGRDICSKPPSKSLWVKIRSKVYIAVAIVAAVYLGPAILQKVSGVLAGGESGVAAGGAAGSVGTAAETSTFISRVKQGIEIYNKANQINAMIHGELPPPPIGITGSTFREVAFNLVKKEAVDAAKEYAVEQGMEYVQKKMTEREEQKLREEIAALQIELDALIPKGTPIQPATELSPDIRNKIIEMQNIEKQRGQNTMLAVAAIAGGTLLLAG